MKFLLKSLQNSEGELHGELLIDIAGIITILEEKADQYLPDFLPILLKDLKNVKENDICDISIGVVGDISRAVSKEIFLVYYKEIMDILFSNLLKNKIGETLKLDTFSQILVCFGDIALITGKHFEPYLSNVMKILEASCSIKYDKNNNSSIFSFNDIREHILDAYTEIIQGLKNDNVSFLFESYIPHVIKFVQIAYSDENKNEDIRRASVGLIGDLAQTFGSKISKDLRTQAIKSIITDAMKSTDPLTQKNVIWAKGIVDKL